MRAAIAELGDVEAICAIIAECRRALEAQDILQWDDQYPSRSFFQAAITAGNLFALREDGGVVGIAVLDDWQPPEWSTAAWRHRDESFQVIHAFAIAPRIQRRGHGTFLLNFCEDSARAHGCASVRLDAFSENVGSLRFYERHGYRFCGEVRFASKPSGHQRYFCYQKSLVR